MIPIVYGYPTPATFAAAERVEVAIGGCVIRAEDPTHLCCACAQEVILDEPDICASCCLQLDGDPEDDPIAAGGSICGECNRARNCDAEEEARWRHSESPLA